jgi:hypothetical protein
VVYYHKKKKIINGSKMEDWLSLYLDCKNVKIRKNKGGGDCFFLALEQALGVPYKDLRCALANSVTIQDYYTYFEFYKDYVFMVNGLIIKYAPKYKNVKTDEEITQINMDLNDKNTFSGRVNWLERNSPEISKKVSHNEFLEFLDIMEQVKEFSWVGKIKNLRDFRTFIKSANYWCDWMSIDKMQHILQKQFVVFDETNKYKTHPIKKIGFTKFDELILMNYKNNNHYELITLDNEAVITRDNLPVYLIKHIQ